MTLSPTAQDQRAADILASVRSAFAEKGFDGASMQDLARAAGISVGNFYRYFPSKAAIVTQLITCDLDEMERSFAEVISAPQPFQALRKHVQQHILMHQASSKGQIWAEITAAALRKPEIGLATCHMETAVSGFLLQVFARETGLPSDEVVLRFGPHAAFIMLLMKSAVMQPPQPMAQRDALNALILQSIDQTLADIARAAQKA